jgi:hypothetical protein
VQRGGQAEIELPFPFESLLARLDGQLQREPTSPLPPVKRVLIPLGRSLQRTAAAPDYFAYPRVVVAVDASRPRRRALLKDRLYIGYQEKSAVLEVISYNEEAGRFEFQLVKDYRAGGKPKVVYANRTLCFACHQNGAPIFSRALWDESNANPQVAALLLASGRRFYGIPVERGVDVPYAIDNASERANGFALTQRLWLEGCGGNDVTAQRCRAGLFAATLRHALAGGQSWTPMRTSSRRWPCRCAPKLAAAGPAGWRSAIPTSQTAIPCRACATGRLTAPPEWLFARRRAFRPAAAATTTRSLAGRCAGRAAQAARRTQRVCRRHRPGQLDAALARPATVPVVRVTAPCRFAASSAASRASLRCAAPGGTLLEGTLAWQAGRPLMAI